MLVAVTKCDLKYPELDGERKQDLYKHGPLQALLKQVALAVGINEANVYPVINAGSKMTMSMEVWEITFSTKFS